MRWKYDQDINRSGEFFYGIYRELLIMLFYFILFYFILIYFTFFFCALPVRVLAKCFLSIWDNLNLTLDTEWMMQWVIEYVWDK